MYRYYVAKRNPVASWIMDTTVPFFDNIASGLVATKKTGTSDPTTSVPLVAGALFSSVFKSTSVGKFQCPYFLQGAENQTFVLEAWILPITKTSTGPQQILSHDTIYDGLTINGKVITFSTTYLTAPAATISYDLQIYKKAHVVAVHTAEKNELWVNNVLVNSIALTTAQKTDKYAVAGDGYLYSGLTASTQELAMNSVAFYGSIDGTKIAQNFAAGNNAVPQAKISPQFNGFALTLGGISTNTIYSRTWSEDIDFMQGIVTNLAVVSNQIVPRYGPTGNSLPGTWITTGPLDIGGDVSIYGASVEWSGSGITVDASLDGVTWASATSGDLVSVITNGSDPTGKNLWIRVNFTGGLPSDPAYLDSISITAYRDIKFENHLNRTVGTTYPAVLRRDYEPNLFRDDNGVDLKSQTLTIGVDTGAEAQVARTLELWIKPKSGTVTISVGGTKYRNGVTDTTLPLGEWSCIHYVAAADISTSITVQGDCIVGQLVMYPTALTAGNISQLYSSYVGIPVMRFTDAGPIGISETSSPVPLTIYSHVWQIVAGG